MSSWFLISAQVRPINTNGVIVGWTALSRNNNISQHMLGLQGIGMEVIDLKITPYECDTIVQDTAYDADATPGFGELIDEDRTPSEDAGSST